MIGGLIFHLPLVILCFLTELRWEYVLINFLWVMAVQFLVDSRMKRVNININSDGEIEVKEEQ